MRNLEPSAVASARIKMGSVEISAAKTRWALTRLALGVAQMIGASVGVALLAVGGITRWSIAVALAATALTVVSIALFGRRSV